MKLKQEHLIDIICPTWNNNQYLLPMINSILRHNIPRLFKITVVNNGDKSNTDIIRGNKAMNIIDAGENLGWEGGLKAGLAKTNAPFVMFINDDILLPDFSRTWLLHMIQHFKHKEVAAVGPASNFVMGKQSIFVPTNSFVFETRYLIFFCVLLRREALEKVGGVDDTLPGGDDIDLSIRLRKNGYKLIADKNVFLYHFGGKTGERLRGQNNIAGGWNSPQMTETTNFALIKKHGLKSWFDTLYGGWGDKDENFWESSPDVEGKLVKKWIKGKVIFDLGCGDNKTVPNAIGFDIVSHGDKILTLDNKESVADVVCNLEEEILYDGQADTIIARHILEHMVDTLGTIKNVWLPKLKKGGRLIIAVPDEEVIKSIPLNLEHKHTFTIKSLEYLLNVAGCKVIERIKTGNNISFIIVAEKL